MIHVLTLSWNGEHKLNALAPGLIDNLKSSGLDWHWHIKDNGSKDNTLNLFNDNKNITVYDYGHNRDNFAQGMNWLFEKAEPKDKDYILLLNNDVVFADKKSLSKMVDLHGLSRSDVVGAKLLFSDTNRLQHAGVIFSEKYGLMPYHFRPNEEDDHNSKKNRYFQAVTAAVALVTASSFKEVGGFDTGFKWAFDDIDLFLRINQLKKNNIIYCGQTNIYHEESASLKKNPVNKLFINENVGRFRSKWSGKYKIDHGEYLKNPDYRVYG